MNRLLRILAVAILALACSFEADAQVEKGQKSFGLHGGYVTRNHSGMAGLEFEYTFSRRCRLSPSIDYIFSNRNTDGLMFNLDYHCPFALNKSRTLNIYPLAGINYASWHMKGVTTHTEAEEDVDVSSREGNFGLDFGAGLEYYVKPTLKLSVEGKFNWIKHHNTGLFFVGISYVF